MFKAHQAKDKNLQQRVKLAKARKISFFSTKEVEGVELIHYNNKICVPITLVTRVMEHYHEHLCHPGQQRMERSIGAIYTWPKREKISLNMSELVMNVKCAKDPTRKGMD